MIVLTTINELQAFTRTGSKLGLVPTMGALHAGHASLMYRSIKECDQTVVSIFVNPTQFDTAEDLRSYPRTLDKDVELSDAAGVDAVFAPSAHELYPNKQRAWVDVEGMTDVLCGAKRPGHFRGVTTVVSKLFNIIRPTHAYFGQKDAQQVLVIKRMALDLNIPINILTCPTLREPDGLAISSRNVHLSSIERQRALCISHALAAASTAFEGGESQVDKLSKILQDVLLPDVDRLDYAEFRDALTLESVNNITAETLVAIAAYVGNTRLIDNITITPSSS